MRKNNNIIEINGQRYDATTGALLTHPAPNAAPAKPAAARPAAPRTPKPAMRDVIRPPAKRSSPRAPASSRTLMRQVVKKPGPSLKRHSKAQGHAASELAKQPLASVTLNTSAQRLDAKRLQHASQVAKSHLISHFSPIAAGGLDQLPAGSAPPQPSPAARAAHTAKPRPVSGTGKRPHTTADILERALQQATSHQEPPPEPVRHGKTKRRVAIGGAIGLSVLVLGVIVTQNLSSVQLQMASAKAGFNASLPNYQPAGYSLGQLNYSNGVVAVQFHSNSNDGHYSITQKTSSWDSTTLRDTFVVPTDPNYQTIQASGRTIYVYGQDNATWVNGGIWYVIQSDGSLSSRQLVDLATSL